MLYPVYNQSGKKLKEIKLDPNIFGLEVKDDLINEAVRYQKAAQRQVIAHTKTKAEVRGGGRKPWRQKGTGRARAGSTRSPIWVGGGVTFGPRKDRTFRFKMNKKARRKALLAALSSKVRDKELVLVDRIVLKEIKAKKIDQILDKLPFRKKSVLIILPEHDRKIEFSARNILKVKTLMAWCLNILDLLSYKYVLMPVETVNKIKETYKKD